MRSAADDRALADVGQLLVGGRIVGCRAGEIGEHYGRRVAAFHALDRGGLRYLFGRLTGGHGGVSTFTEEPPWPEQSGKIVGRYLMLS